MFENLQVGIDFPVAERWAVGSGRRAERDTTGVDCETPW
jgi:hypothetical protein